MVNADDDTWISSGSGQEKAGAANHLTGGLGLDAFTLALLSPNDLPGHFAKSTTFTNARDGASGRTVTPICGIPIDPGPGVTLALEAEVSVAAGGSLSLNDPNCVPKDWLSACLVVRVHAHGADQLCVCDDTVTAHQVSLLCTSDACF